MYFVVEVESVVHCYDSNAIGSVAAVFFFINDWFDHIGGEQGQKIRVLLFT